MKRFAVIDLGTNTFHLLIAGRKSDHDFIEIYRERFYVRLGKDGINQISKSAIKRALDAMRKFRQIIDLFEAIEVRAFATAAFRSASNADILIHRILREFNIPVEIISGDEEARLIFEGVKYGQGLQRDQNLIMDIGGGSVEFIIGSKKGISWSTSLAIGASILKNKFHRSEPISAMELCELRLLLKKELAPLRTAIESRQFNTLIGSSGTFDVLAEALQPIKVIDKCQVLSVQDFHVFKEQIIQLNFEERSALKSIPENRADLIVVALILLDEVLALNPEFKFLLVSPYALKEGMIAEMIQAFHV